MRRWIVGAALIALPVAASAMTVAEFLAKAEAIKSRGVAAMFAPEIPQLKAAIAEAGAAYRADVDAGRAAGRNSLGCPPPKGKANVTSGEIVADFSTIPVAQRNTTSVKTAFYAMMRKRFPCR